MFYDPLLYKMIPWVFAILNNKKFEGYLLIFDYIKNNILYLVKNDISKIKWYIYTTDFEIALYSSFNKVFNFIKNIKHNGCFYHYMANIRKYLVQNSYTTTDNIPKYDYIISNIYYLPFKKNIQNNINKEIDKICKKNKFYKKFNDYLKSQWSFYFENQSLVLREGNVKFRTNNSLENFNRYFKNNINMKPKYEFIKLCG